MVEDEITEVDSNNVDHLLKSIIDRTIRAIKSKIVNTDDYLQIYFIYHLPRMRAFQYLVSGTEESYDFAKSFTYSVFENNSDNFRNGIIKDFELAEIIEYALNSFEVVKLLEQKDFKEHSHFVNLTKYERLKKIISIFNKADIDEIHKISVNSPTVFNLLLRIGLISLPQLPTNPEYSYFDGKPNDGKLTLGKEKQEKINKNISQFILKKNNNISTLPFSDRLFLLITLIEGCLWLQKFEDHDTSLRDYFYGNLYDLLNGSQSFAYKYNSIYLKPFEFYIYGNFIKRGANNNKDKEDKEKKIKKILRKYFSKFELLSFIQFSKFFLAENNYNNAQHFIELGSPFIPKSIVHGITSIILPEKIGIFSEEDNQLKKEQCYCFNIDLYKNLPIDGLEIINNPWALYKEDGKEFPTSLNNFNRKDSIALNKDECQILIRVKNSINQSKVIIIQLFSDDKDEVLNSLGIHVVNNFDDYKYTLKAYVEKLFFINRSVTLNTDTNNWFSKAFCKFYCEFDRKRLSDEIYGNHIKYRKWELDYFSNLINSYGNDEIHIYDIGVGYGRLETKLKEIKILSEKQIKFIGVDLSKTLLQNAKDVGLIFEQYHCDFRSIDLFGKDKADIVCFIYTTFGYFKDSAENIEVLKKAYDLLKPNGTLIIEQFNPSKTPDHCNTDPESFNTKIEGRDYRLVKTSNLKQPHEIKDENNNPINLDYALYYGNYVYFDCSGNTEEMIKCDTYEIRLYTEDWFKNIYSHATFHYYNLDGKEETDETKNNNQPIMVVEISKKITKELLKTLNKKVYDLISVSEDINEDFNIGNILETTFEKINNIDGDESIIKIFNLLEKYYDKIISTSNRNPYLEEYKKILG